MLSHKPPNLSLPILCFRETPLSVKSSLIMTSLFEYQKSTIKCQQFTAVKFKNVSKHGKIISCSFYLTIIVWNRKHFFMGTLKYWYLGHVHPLVICSVQLFLVTSGWKISHVIRFWLRLMINFCQSCISVDALHLEITSNHSCCEFCFIFCIESDRQHCSLEHVTDLLKCNHGTVINIHQYCHQSYDRYLKYLRTEIKRHPLFWSSHNDCYKGQNFIY